MPITDATYEDLLAAILAAPDDDAPRVILADRLDELGEAARAEFIRVQCELAGIGDVPGDRAWCREEHDKFERRQVLRQREKELADAHAHVWAHGISASLVVFARGFLHAVTMRASNWIANGDAILAAHPVLREVRLSTLPAAHVPAFNALRPWKKPLKWGGDMLWSFEAEWPTVKEWHLPQVTCESFFPTTLRGTLRIGDRTFLIDSVTITPTPEPEPDDDEARPRPARRRSGHSRMPGWLAEQRARPGRR